ncbi:RNA-dependent RNA polymerase [Colletotrichum karsti]|uniref:RNA-dependent RNA polymerase n=1 Tax=Colletotrichum karsti TaxID=1095194 RepID=A0A9P6IIS9_9PEZI|nr:RNA-dependent RNA polymerase [Colletotrichum karsti]KAF9880390.1 RNA-dependent RNA polymerase [Colletotrichum karsti]
MAPQTKTAQSVPRTPKKSKQNERVNETIEKLNRDYNLAIEIPDVTLTPLKISNRRKHDPAFARSSKIVSDITYHCRQPSPMIDKILHSFHMEARAASQKWIRLTDCYDESGPATPQPPKAASPGEVLDLQEVLLSVLERADPNERPRTFARAKSVPAVYPSIEGPKPKKRPQDDGKKDSPKRVKASPPDGEDVDEVIADALDKVPSRSRSAKPKLLSAQFSTINQASQRHPTSFIPPRTLQSMRQSVYGNPSFAGPSFATSASTSHASIFSVAKGPLPSTQDTVPAPSAETKRRFAPSQEPKSSQSQDLFPASSGHLDALNVSFTEHEAETSSRLYTHPPGLTQPLGYVPTPAGGSSPGLTTIYSEISGIDDSALYQPISSPLKRSEPVLLLSRLDATWPRFPAWLNRAPFAIAWEITRIALHCGVDLGEVVMKYDEAWINYSNLWKTLLAHPSFAGKAFPERPTNDAWTAGLSGFKSPRGQHVTFTASLSQSKKKSGPMFSLTMNPIALDQGCRLHRHFGSDRFLELVIPSPNSWEKPISSPEVSQEVVSWFTSRLHYLAGRLWRAFYARDAGHKKPQTNVSLGPDPKPVFQERLSLFAENGNNFHAALPIGAGSLDNPRELRVKLEVRDMLDWLLQLDSNVSQPYLKLFARIQLGLSKTTPVVVLDRTQIRHQDEDMLSPTGKVMNDGIGRMSRLLARKIKDVLGLADVPSAIQGRLGPAKGMWIIDVQDTVDDLWIETWPSQRKWICDFLDPEHRTLEVRAHAVEPRSASLNVQFLPVLEDRAIDKRAMRQAIADNLVDELNRELEGQKSAMKYPVQFRLWVNENSLSRRQRLANNRVPFLAGLPDSSEETMNVLIDGGFEPSQQKYLQDIAWNLRRTKCENLKKKMSIKIPNSAYFFMVVDFSGILEENEVHLCFSSKFQTESFSDSMLHACDVLVARSPAHFVSDVQRVKAVFKPELHALKDVIVFSAKGNVPLADKLSGGDYDGDKAWVCWEPSIVSNFKNHDVPPSPDLSKYLRKDK